jgi:predicted dehydrogenase
VLTVAVIGAGSFAQNHLRSFARTGRASVRWICDVDAATAERCARDHSVERSTTDLDAVLADPAVDLVDLVTPVHLHAAQAIRALRAGKSVVCEKPMAATLDQALEMVAAAEQAPGQLFVKYHQRFDPVHDRLRQVLADGTYGRPLAAHVRLLGDHLAALRSRSHWRGDPRLTGGGCLFESGAHVIDLLHFLFGRAVRVTARTHQLAAGNPAKGEDSASVVLEFAAGPVVTFTGYWAAIAWSWEKEIFTSDRSVLRIETGSSNALVHRGADGDRVLAEQPEWFDRSVDASLAHFVDCCAGLDEPRSTLADVVEPMRTLDAAYRSAAGGTTVELD